MSGDVQPRKRKDKKRKREDESVPLTFYPKDVTEDVNIHIHKEDGTGGGICAKVVFFILFSALIVLIGLIITEHRGLTDLDVAESESRYSQLFDGWIDEKQDDHHTLDDHDNEHFDDEEQDHDDGHTLDDHDDEHIDDEPSEEREHTLDDHDSENFDEDDQSIQPSEENEDDEEEPEESQENRSEIKTGRYRREISDEDDNERESQQDLDATEEEEVLADSETKEDDETYESEDREDDEDDEENTDSQQYQEDTAEEDEVEETATDSDIKEDTEEIQDDSENENDDRTLSEEDEGKDDASSEDEVDPIKESQEDGENQSSENELISEEQKVQKKISDNNVDSNEIEELLEPRNESNEEDETENVVNEKVETTEKEEPSEDTPENSEGSDIPGSLSMIVKAIIGAAILAVGHFVLIKKWKSDSSDEDKDNLEREEVHLDLSRRNTIIPPPTLQEIEQDVEYANEEYSDEEETASNEGFRVVPEDVKKKYEQLRSSYSRSISPESDTGEDNIKTGSDDELDIENIEEEELEEVEEEEIQEEEVEEEDYEEEEYEEEDDDELMKKLEAKYGKLKLEPKGRTPSPDQEESDSERLSDDNNDYEYSSITNEDDWEIHEDLDEAQRKLPDNAAKALKMFEKILEKYPSSPRGIYGLAQALDALAEMKKSNELLEEAVANYLRMADLRMVPDELYKAAMERCIDRLRFRGKYGRAVTVHLKLIKRYPSEPNYRNQLAITYLTIGRVEQARLVLEETLQKWPEDGCALVHYGFIWKTALKNFEKGVFYMQKGVESQDPCVIDGRFYFHLGDALFRLGSKDKALKLYEDGVKHKLFLSKYQRSLYNVPRLTARPWWEQDQLLSYHLLFKDLIKNWQVIRNEGMSVLNENAYFQDESENLRDTGNWKQFELFARESHPDASGCRRGQTKFSVMHPGTHVWAHCGPTNCRLRVHLGLKVPARTFIRVGDEVRSWHDGKLLIFDDSFEHEVWHNGTDTRLVLIVDVWHPELSMTERGTLSSL